MEHEHPHRTTPQQAGQAVAKRAAEQPAKPERRDKPAKRPHQKRPVNPAQNRVGKQIGRIARAPPTAGMDEQPPHVRVYQPPHRTEQSMAVSDMRTMRVALPVRERVMLAVISDPRNDRAFDRRRTKDRQRRPDRTRGLKRAVGEQAVKAHRHAKTGKHVQQQEHENVVPAQQAVPQLPANEEHAEDRNRRHDPHDHPITSLADHRLDVIVDGSH